MTRIWPTDASSRRLAAIGIGFITLGLVACAGQHPELADWDQRCGPTETIRTGWLTETEYLRAADAQRARGCYPVAIKAAAAPGAEPMRRYRATFKPHPDNITDWRATIAKSAAEDATLDTAFTRRGYTRIWQDGVTDANGTHVVQSIWVWAR